MVADNIKYQKDNKKLLISELHRRPAKVAPLGSARPPPAAAAEAELEVPVPGARPAAASSAGDGGPGLQNQE